MESKASMESDKAQSKTHPRGITDKLMPKCWSAPVVATENVKPTSGAVVLCTCEQPKQLITDFEVQISTDSFVVVTSKEVSEDTVPMNVFVVDKVGV